MNATRRTQNPAGPSILGPVDNSSPNTAPPGRIVSQVLVLALSRGFASLSQAILLLLLARATDPATFGLVGAILALATLLALADLGLQPLATRLYALPQDRPRALRAMYVQRTLLCLAAGALATVSIIAAVVGWLPWWVLLTPVWACAERIVLGDLNLHVATGTSRPQVVALALLRFTALGLFGGIMLLSRADAGAFWVAMTVGAIAAAIYTRHSLPRFTKPDAIEAWALIREARHFWFTNIAAVVRNQDVTLVSTFGGKMAAGLYALPIRLTTPFNLVMDALSTAALPIARRNDKRSMRSLYFLAVIAMLLSSLAGVTAIIFAPEVIKMLAGAKFQDSAPALRVVIVAALVGLPETFLTRTLQAQGHEAEISRISTTIAILTLALIPVGSVQNGALGAACSLLLIAIVELALLAALIRRKYSAS